MIVDRFTAVYSRAGVTTPPNQDVMTMSIHFARRTTLEGSTSTAMDATLQAAVEARWDTFETTYKAMRNSWSVLSLLTWHRGFPSGSPPHAALRTQTRTSAGTAGATVALPPQCAMNVTLRASNRRHWGRFALGGLVATSRVDGSGLFNVGDMGALQSAAATMLNGCLTDGAAPVVYTRPKFLDASQTVVQNQPQYWPVIGVRMDIVIDVVRRRRWEHAGAAQRQDSDLTVPAASPSVYAGPYNDTRG